MKEVELVTLEDGRVCAVLNELELDDIIYVYLVNTSNNQDYIIRKKINNELVGLADEEELKKAMAYLIVKNQVR